MKSLRRGKVIVAILIPSEKLAKLEVLREKKVQTKLPHLKC